MGDTSERSKPPGLPPRCPCGFWGSSKTMNLCSKCFADIQKKQPDDDCPSQDSSSETTTTTITTITNSGTTAAPATTTTTNTTTKTPSISSSVSPSLSLPTTTTTELPVTKEPSPMFATSKEGVSSTVTAQSTMCTPTKRPRESASGSESEATPEKRPRAEAKDGGDDGSEEQAGSTPKQKNRRRCYSCQSKLELVQQELGSCRCGYVFCMLHRLPEQHDCLFDHLGRGREEAVLKMVKLDRKVGRSCQRIGEECS
ncbi:AN1-type zinc finger protein 3-like isoform X2 [Syngnathoides biaculeatus]|uniref:AN1-type zinc finger protein 3-like isoform X2 n=1 Tax=Syngnathoides biaculeatus TaxID=300417 RepID=UPI002ADD36D8|nr:AN1-type zinc finger protein 3-like isoform X2 [Syngnathoides biaculeatus]